MIKKPALIVDEGKCRNNIKNMADKASKNNLIFRPHFKTHQSLEIGRWYKDFGVDKITVSSVTMAEYFSAEWDDITIAFSVNLLEIDEINSLAERINLNLLVESEEAALFLKENLSHSAGIFIKVDSGYKRTGVDPDNLILIDRILNVLESSEKLIFKGFLSHAGHTYDCRRREDIIEITERSFDIMDVLKKHYIKKFPELIISLGDTPGCSITDKFRVADEIRPGNFVFYDLTQNQIGSTGIENIAVALVCPVIAVHRERNEVVIYGGGVHFSKDSIKDDEYGTIYGKAVEYDNLRWKGLIDNVYISKLSQEHGIVNVPDSEIDKYKPGDIICFLPVHSCLTSNLMRIYLSTSRKIIKRL